MLNNKSFFFDKKKTNDVALISQNIKITYKELQNKIKRIKKYIEGKNIIIIFCENHIDCIEFYLAAFESDNIVLLADSSLPIKKYHSLIGDYQPKYIFSKKNIEDKNTILQKKFTEFCLYQNKNHIKKLKNLNKIKLLMPTSGSTGSSKYVMQTKDNIINNMKSINCFQKLSKIYRTITTLPMNYVYGISIINTFIKYGCSIVVSNHSIIDKNFWFLLNKNKVNFFNGVPYLYEILDKLKFFDKKNLIKVFTQAGGALDLNLKKKIFKYCKKFNKKIYFMYGSTEATARMAYIPITKLPKKINSIGKAIKGGKFSIRNKFGNIIKNYQKGSIYYHGKNVTVGYCENVFDLQKKIVKKEILNTGDYGYMDNDGFVFLNGRIDRIIKVYGHRLNLADIEDTLNTNNIKSVAFSSNNLIRIYCMSFKSKKELEKMIKNNLNINFNLFKIFKINKIPINKNMKIIYDEKKFISSIQ